MYRGDKLWDFSKRATDGFLAPLVPGIVGGWAALHERYGSLPWPKILAPAIEYAEKGFPVTPAVVASMTTGEMSKARRYPYGLSLFSKPDGSTLSGGDLSVQRKNMGRRSRAMAAKGPDTFYKGVVGQKIASHFQENGAAHRRRGPRRLPRDLERAHRHHLPRAHREDAPAWLVRHDHPAVAERARGLRPRDDGP